MNSNRVLKILKSAMTCLIFLSILFSAADAQTAKRKKRRAVRKTTRAVLTIPSNVIPPGDAEIVSQAGSEDAAPNQVLIQPEPQPAETLESKIDKVGGNVKDLKARIKTLEANKPNVYDERQRRLALNLDILAKAEERAESLRKQMFDLVEKENTLKMRLEQIETNSTPEMIDRQVAFVGTLRPEELREARRKNMESEKTNIESLLTQIQSSRQNLDENVQKADALVEKLRAKLEKDIDDALTDKDDEPKN